MHTSDVSERSLAKQFRVQFENYCDANLSFTVLPQDHCKLYCQVESNQYYMLRDKVIDGTPCGPDTFHICVNGQCKPAGCDHVLNSTAELDTCGVCRGDNSTCQRITGSYNASVYGYTKVAKIPAGSSYIDIRQHGWLDSHNDSNYLGKTFLSKCMHTLYSAHRLSLIKIFAN